MIPLHSGIVVSSFSPIIRRALIYGALGLSGYNVINLTVLYRKSLCPAFQQYPCKKQSNLIISKNQIANISSSKKKRNAFYYHLKNMILPSFVYIFQMCLYGEQVAMELKLLVTW